MQSARFNILILAAFFLITFPAYSALLHPGMLTSHDGEGHIIRMFEFNQAIEGGHFPVRWSKRLNWGLGYPFFNFNYPGIYYLGFLLQKAGLDLLSAFKLMLLLSFPLSGFFTFLWLRSHFTKTAAFIGGLFYTLIPYHFVNVYVRGNLGETLALTLVPLNLYLVSWLTRKPTLAKAVFISLGLSMLILTHNLSAFLFIPIILIYSLLLSGKTGLKYLFFAFFMPLLITAFFWVPALYDKQFITIGQTFPLYYLKHFSSLRDVLYSKWGYGGSGVGSGQMSVQIGLVNIFIFVCSLGALIIGLKAYQKRLILFFFSLTIIAFLMMLSVSKPVWDLAGPIQYLQFPWRLLAITTLGISFLAGFTLSVIFKIIPKKMSFIVLIILTLALFFFNRNHWRANKYYGLPDYWFLDGAYGSTTTVDGEHTPKWQLDNSPSETARYQIVSGEAKVKSKVWKTGYHLFQIEAKLPSLILDRTVYFPGWTVFVDSQKITSLDPYDPRTKGLIGFLVPEGNHLVEVKLLEPTLNMVADMISLSSVGLLLGILVYSKARKAA